MLIRAKSMDGSLGESNSLLLKPTIDKRFTKSELAGIHKDLRPIIWFDKPDKKSEMVLRRQITKKSPK